MTVDCAQDHIAMLGQHLLSHPEPMPTAEDLYANAEFELEPDGPPIPAAVLIALIEREAGYSVLYTARSSALRRHSGQVAFPGGRIDPEDPDAAHAALREANEEVALRTGDARVLGYMPYYFTGTNYFITPVVAIVEPSAPFVPNPDEVVDVFEVSLARLSDRANWGQFEATHGAKRWRSWHIDHNRHRIWGITADLTLRFCDLLRRSAEPRR
ncbi:NUDIX hydrolase [Pelagibacterium montanilacus]|uniref:NUDIX hydrolase n=1 Tax=Pelagibacterium montanilacus TaxID=2185280 RepID=UPI000F8C388B|nr:CoA pyrophosphatase [Pelagibacterium montanilacus]